MAEKRIALFLGLGTNLGDRPGNLRTALEKLDGELGSHWTGLSDFVETEPWGFESPDKFLNAVVRYDLENMFEDDPSKRTSDISGAEDVSEFLEKKSREILKICKKIEREMGRDEEPQYGPDGRRIYRSRIIDIDILIFGDLRLNAPDLKIPHPLIASRPFVLIPLRQIAPEDVQNRVESLI